jgi:dTDP-4-dehydrorhamnose reductase
VRVYITGASGFVGSNLAHVLGGHDAEVIAPDHAEVELTDEATVRRSVAAARPEAVIHAAIWNDPGGLRSNWDRACAEYVGATRNVVGAANDVDAQVVLISTDSVFDGDGGPFAETDRPRPINSYGLLKARSERIVTDFAGRGTVARLAGVQGVHRARPRTPRAQDCGFGYLVASLAQAIGAGRPFTVWDGPGLNQLATPTLASEAAELVWRAVHRGVTGVLHCCGGEHADRVGLARRTVAVFELDPALLRVGPPPAGIGDGSSVPRDTRLDAAATARSLGVRLPTLDETLGRLRAELESAPSLPST